jgi:hypothetical protein
VPAEIDFDEEPAERYLPNEWKQDHGHACGNPDVTAGFEIGGGCREYDGGADLAERLQVGAIENVIPEIIAHG